MKHHKYTQKDFDWTRWGARDVRAGLVDLFADFVVSLEDIKQIPKGERTFDNTVRALEYAGVDLQEILAKVYLLGNVSPEKPIRDLCMQMVAEYEVRIKKVTRSKEIYSALKSVRSFVRSQSEEDQRMYKDHLQYYKRLGFDLGESDEKKLLGYWKDISELEREFAKNIAEDESHILATKEELVGLSDGYVRSLRKVNGKYKVSLDYPELVPFIESAVSAKKRKELSTKYMRQGGRGNITILKKVIELRHKKANLLGHKTHADFVTADRMAKSGQKAYDFMEEIGLHAQKKAQSDLAALRDIKKSDGARGDLATWDIAYYSNKLKSQLYNIDNQKLREYFPLEHVITECFSLYEKLFGIKLVKESFKLWHKDVSVYRIENARGGVVSYMMMDLHPRKGKYGHAAAFNVTSGMLDPEDFSQYRTPTLSLVCNFPQGTKKNPALLSHGEVVTFLHECGHALHHLLGESKNPSQSGLSVKWDFVETPSQMFEYFGWDEKVLKKLSLHYKTGESLSSEMIDKLRESHKHMSGYATIRQVSLSLYDLKLHMDHSLDPVQLYADLTEKYIGLTPPKTQLFGAGFGHLMGYDAGYYSYMWARVFAADAYTVFRTGGGASAQVGKRFRREVLAKGSERDEKKSLKAFLGRNPNKKAFYEDLCLK